MKRLCLSAMLALACTSLAHAQTPRSVDANQLDVAGVKVGMGYDEAIAAASQYLHVDKASLKPEALPSERSLIYLVTHQKLPGYFVHEKDGVRLQVNFAPRVPYDKNNPLVVDQVSYSMPWTPQNVKSFKEALVAKYGEPSGGMYGEWCAEPSPNRGMGCSMYHGTVLKAGDTELTLYAPEYGDAVTRYQQELQSSKPGF